MAENQQVLDKKKNKTIYLFLYILYIYILLDNSKRLKSVIQNENTKFSYYAYNNSSKKTENY